MADIQSLMRELLAGKRVLKALSVAGLISLVLAACAPGIPATTLPPTGLIPSPNVIPTQFASREAQVQSVGIEMADTNPGQATAVIRGILTESCAKLGESQVEYAAGTFRITVYVLSRADIGCAAAETPFETRIPLALAGLAAGSYTVTANGVSADFTLPTETPTATITPTPVPSAVPTSVPTTAPTGAACIDAARFVSDVTVRDNSVIAPNAPFTKTWRLQNTGSCTWDSSYLVSYISGTTMSQQPGYWIVSPGQTVVPGQSVDVSVGMTSPVENGSYQSYWGLKRENGPLMPIQGGANGNSFYVKIRVSDGSPGSGNVTAASIDIELEQGSGTACTPGATYFVHASISADGPTTATYEINSTAGQIAAGNFQNPDTNGLSPVVYGSVTFDQAGTKNVHLRFVGPFPYPDDITVNLQVNGGTWHSSKVSCQS